MIDRDRAVDDVKKIIYELLCIYAWQIHGCIVRTEVIRKSFFTPICTFLLDRYKPFRNQSEYIYLGRKKIPGQLCNQYSILFRVALTQRRTGSFFSDIANRYTISIVYKKMDGAFFKKKTIYLLVLVPFWFALEYLDITIDQKGKNRCTNSTSVERRNVYMNEIYDRK